jgi:hypothetical protein
MMMRSAFRRTAARELMASKIELLLHRRNRSLDHQQ